MSLKNYKDFAEDDYQLFKFAYHSDQISNMLGAISQGICEKYMKHIIAEYYSPNSISEQNDKDSILRTHSLNKLIKFLRNNELMEFSREARAEMIYIDGFYFSTRYPGEDSIEIDKDDLEHCNLAIEYCRNEVLEREVELINAIPELDYEDDFER